MTFLLSAHAFARRNTDSVLAIDLCRRVTRSSTRLRKLIQFLSPAASSYRRRITTQSPRSIVDYRHSFIRFSDIVRLVGHHRAEYRTEISSWRVTRYETRKRKEDKSIAAMARSVCARVTRALYSLEHKRNEIDLSIRSSPIPDIRRSSIVEVVGILTEEITRIT